jgi:hypothetical protein
VDIALFIQYGRLVVEFDFLSRQLVAELDFLFRQLVVELDFLSRQLVVELEFLSGQLEAWNTCDRCLHLYNSSGITPLCLSKMLYVQCVNCGNIEMMRLCKGYYTGGVNKGMCAFDIDIKVATSQYTYYTKSLEISKGQSEYVYRRRTDNKMGKIKRTKRQTTIYKTYI